MRDPAVDVFDMSPSAIKRPDQPGVIEADPREQESWFRELPESAQQRFRKEFEKEARQDEVKRARRRDQMVQCMIEGSSLFFLLEWFVYGLTFWSFLVTIAVGVGTGTAWHKWQTSRALSALVGIGGFLGVRMLCGMGTPFHAMIALLLVTCLSFAFAIPRDSARMGA